MALDDAIEVLPFAAAHIPAFTAWFNTLPNNDVWDDSFVRSRTLDDPTYDPRLMLTAVCNGVPVGAILASVANHAGWVRAFVVAPGHRRQGIGSRLFGVVEQRLRDRGIADVTVGWAVPRYFLPGIDVAYTDAIVFLEQRGYETDREARINMDVVLRGRDFATADGEAALAAAGITVRRAAAYDRSGITALCEKNQHPMWIAETAMALDRSPVPLHVALRNGKVVAFAAHSICGPIHFGPMLTDAARRGMGIGSVLLKRCLQDWQRLGRERCKISWTGPIAFYARAVGATMGRVFWSYHRSLITDDA